MSCGEIDIPSDSSAPGHYILVAWHNHWTHKRLNNLFWGSLITYASTSFTEDLKPQPGGAVMKLNLVPLFKVLKRWGYELVSLSPDRLIIEIKPGQHQIIKSVEPYTMTGPLALWSLLTAAEYVNSTGIPGDIVECGVWRGGSSMLAKIVCDQAGASRKFHLFDTFEGMPQPKAVDIFRDGTSAMEIFRRYQKHGKNEFCYASLEEVKENFAGLGLLDENVTFVKGKVEKTLSNEKNLPAKIAILRLDTDWYDSTKKELEVLYPRLVKGGVLIIDDYGYWQGARKAVDEYFTEPVLMHRVDKSVRLIVKN